MIVFLLMLQLAAPPSDSGNTDGSPPRFTVQLVDGTSVVGPISQWGDGSLSFIGGDGSTVEYPLEKVARIQNSIETSSETDAAKVGVGLTGGSLFSASDFQLGSAKESGSKSQFRMRFKNSTIQLPTEAMRFVRFRKPTPALAEQWQELLEANHDGDIIVIRRSDDSLDYLEGVIKSISPTSVQFDFDGDEIPVEVTKLEGAIFFHQGRRNVTKSPTMRFTFANGDTIHASSAALTGNTMKINTESSADISILAHDVERIDFTSGRVAYLSDMNTSQRRVTPAIGSRVSANSLSRLLYDPRKDESFAGTPLRLTRLNDGWEESFRKGLAVHSRSELTYRLRGEFKKLKAIVGLEPHRSQSGSIRLVITGDGNNLFDQIIQRSDDPVELDLEIVDTNKLTILVDYGTDGDAGDRLHLCNLRVIK